MGFPSEVKESHIKLLLNSSDSYDDSLKPEEDDADEEEVDAREAPELLKKELRDEGPERVPELRLGGREQMVLSFRRVVALAVC